MHPTRPLGRVFHARAGWGRIGGMADNPNAMPMEYHPFAKGFYSCLGCGCAVVVVPIALVLIAAFATGIVQGVKQGAVKHHEQEQEAPREPATHQPPAA